MVKKTLLSLAIAATAAGLAGCNVSSTDKYENDIDNTPVLSGQPGSQPSQVSAVFNPARQQLPLATDFLFSGSTDGTLVNAAGNEPFFLNGARNPAYNPVFNALNDLDGFSTAGQLYIPFSGSLQEGVLPEGSVFLVPLSYTGGPKQGTLDEVPFDLAKLASTSIRAEVISYADAGASANSVLRISPLTPLANDTRYLVVLTNAIKDTKGQPTVMPNQFEYLIGDQDLLNPALGRVRELTKGWIQLARGFVANVAGGNPANVTLAYTFTTGGTTEVLNTMAAPGNADSALSNKNVPANVQHIINTQDEEIANTMLTGAGLTPEQIGGARLLSTLPAPSPRKSNFDHIASVNTALIVPNAESTFRTGRIELPYYLAAPEGGYAGESPADGYACTPSSAADVACLTKKFTATNVISEYWKADVNLIENLLLAQGASAETAATKRAPSHRVTNLFPFAKEQGKVSAPVMVVEPVASCGAKPAEGWPVVIYQHGINGNRMQTLPLAEQFAQACYATIAIDLPMHGVVPGDTFTLGGNPVPVLAAVNASENSAQNLAVFAGLPSETQQLIIQGKTVAERHFGLTASADGITPMAMTGSAADRSGSLYINLARFQTTRDNNRQAVMDLLNLNASIPFMDIDNNPTTVDFDKDKIYFAGISLGGIIGTQFVAVNNLNTHPANPNGNRALNRVQAAVIGVAGGGLPKLLENSGAFGPQIVGGLTNPASFNLTQGGASYESLLYVMQATVDSADPINFAQQLNATQTPFTFIKSIGDTVVPNSVASAPLAGTDPLVARLGAVKVDDTTIGAVTAPVRALVELKDEFSSHTSMARPDTSAPNAPETFEMLADHFISLFDNPAAPTLTDTSAGAIDPVPVE